MAIRNNSYLTLSLTNFKLVDKITAANVAKDHKVVEITEQAKFILHKRQADQARRFKL